MSAIIDMRAKTTRTLGDASQPEESVTEQDVGDAKKLSRLLTRVLKDLAELKRRFAPRVNTYVNLDVNNTGATVYQLVHNFGGPVAWWVVGWTTATSAPPSIRLNAAKTTPNTLALVSNVTGTVSIRVEELG